MGGFLGLPFTNKTVFITLISLFWRKIYISRQLNLFLRTMFVVVGLSLVTTTLNRYLYLGHYNMYVLVIPILRKKSCNIRDITMIITINHH